MAPSVMRRRHKLRDLVASICRTEETGCVVTLRQNGVLIRDLASWPQAFTDTIHQEYPSSRVLMFQNESSLSGFSVIVSFGNESIRARNCFVFFIFFTIMMTVLFFMVQTSLHEHWIVKNQWINPKESEVKQPYEPYETPTASGHGTGPSTGDSGMDPQKTRSSHQSPDYRLQAVLEAQKREQEVQSCKVGVSQHECA